MKDKLLIELNKYFPLSQNNSNNKNPQENNYSNVNQIIIMETTFNMMKILILVKIKIFFLNILYFIINKIYIYLLKFKFFNHFSSSFPS